MIMAIIPSHLFGSLGKASPVFRNYAWGTETWPNHHGHRAVGILSSSAVQGSDYIELPNSLLVPVVQFREQFRPTDLDIKV